METTVRATPSNKALALQQSSSRRFHPERAQAGPRLDKKTVNTSAFSEKPLFPNFINKSPKIQIKY